MVSSADKTLKLAPSIHPRPAGATFFRKAGADSFFGVKEAPGFFSKPIQAKLTVSTPDDPQEQEADAVADKVMRMSDPVSLSPVADKKEAKLGRKEEEEVNTKREDPVISKIQCKSRIQAKSIPDIQPSAGGAKDGKAHGSQNTGGIQATDVSNVSLYRSDIMCQSGRGPPAATIPFEQTLSSSKGGGSPLPDTTRSFMENRFNADFSGIRVHTGSTAEQLSSSIDAQAFAHGNDLYFNKGKFSPHSTEGGTLLAHELTHTIQQGASRSQASARLVAKKSNAQPQFSRNLSRENDDAGKNIEIPALKTPVLSKDIPINPSPIVQKIAPAATKNPVQAVPVLKPKLEEAPAEKEKQVSEKEQDVHVHHKSGDYGRQPDCCNCNNNLHCGGVWAKYGGQQTYMAADDGTSMITDIADSGRGPPPGRAPPVILQRSTGTVQRSIVDDVLSMAGSVTECIPLNPLNFDLDEIKRCAKRKAQQAAMHIPGYKALRVVLGEDPITGDGVARSGRNFIEAAFDLVPGGNLLHKKLDEIHKLDAAATWIDERIETVTSLVRSLTSEITNFWKGIGATDITSPMDTLRRGFNIVLGFIGNVKDFAVNTAKDLLKMVKDFLLDKIVDFIKTQTTAYPLLTVILGKDPVTEKEVKRNGTNILNALLDLGGDEGKEQKKQMEDTGTFKKVADFIDEGIKVFSGAYDEIIAAFHNIWDSISIESLMDPSGTFAKIYNGFAAPIRRVLDFVMKVGAAILKFIKEVLMKRLSAWAKTVRGYALVTVIIGKDPFTGEEVPRTVENIIHGFMSLMDGGEEQFRQMKESGAIAKAEAKINAAVKKLNMTPQAIIQLFIDLWESFSIKDLVNPIAAFQRILEKFGEPIARLIAFVIEIVKIVVEVILIIMQFPFDLINNIIAKAMQAFEKIKADPIGFLKNLLRAIKEGFVQFFNNILKHLLAGLTGWLMSELKDANVKAPKDFGLGTIIGWVLELLGISMEKIWEKLAKHPRIGPERVAKIRGMISKLEGIWTFIKDVQERGMAAIWDKIVEKLSNLWDTVLDAIKNWIMEQIVTKMVTKLLSMLDPTGIMAVVNSAIALYKAIQSFIKYLKQMLEIVNSFVEGVAEIANGNTKKAANFLESTLARGVPVVIGFLANQVGLSGVGKKVGEMIEKVREMVDKALTWLVNKAVDTGLNLLDKVVGAAKGAAGAVLGWLGFRQRFTTQTGVPHTAYIRQSGTSAALIIESAPVEALTFFNQKETEIAASSMSPAEKSQKQGRITHGKNLLQGLNAMMNNEAQKNNPRIPQMITEVIGIIREIDPTAAGGGPLPATAVFQPGFSDGVKATSFNASHIHKGGSYVDKSGASVTVAKNHEDGSEPDETKLPAAFNILQGMRLTAGSKWVRFHIVNADYGGKGVDSNLIPTPGFINNPQYLNEFEVPLKGYYAEGVPIWLRASISYRSEFNQLFPSNYSAQGGAMKYQEPNWVPDPAKQKSFSRTIPLPQTDVYNINEVIRVPEMEDMITRYTSVTHAIITILRNRQPAGGYTYYKQMEKAIEQEVYGDLNREFTAFPDPATLPQPTAKQVKQANTMIQKLGSANYVFS